MTEKLLKMLVGETTEFDRETYDVLQQTKSRLKRNGDGEWTSKLGPDGLFVKRIK